MHDRTLPPSVLETFRSHLQHAERSPSTIEKYLRSIRAFACWLNGRTVTKDAVAAWKSHLVARSYAPAPSTRHCQPSTAYFSIWAGRTAACAF